MLKLLEICSVLLPSLIVMSCKSTYTRWGKDEATTSQKCSVNIFGCRDERGHNLVRAVTENGVALAPFESKIARLDERGGVYHTFPTLSLRESGANVAISSADFVWGIITPFATAHNDNVIWASFGGKYEAVANFNSQPPRIILYKLFTKVIFKN